MFSSHKTQGLGKAVHPIKASRGEERFGNRSMGGRTKAKNHGEAIAGRNGAGKRQGKKKAIKKSSLIQT